MPVFSLNPTYRFSDTWGVSGHLKWPAWRLPKTESHDVLFGASEQIFGAKEQVPQGGHSD